MPWYEDWFDSDAYEVVYRQRDSADARRLIDLVERAAQPAAASRVLDVACGRGRHAILLAQRGYRVTGIDLSSNAIRTARRRAREEGLGIDFEVADMRELPFDGAFDGVVNLFTSFGYFDDDREHRLAIAQMARALRPGGWLVQDFLNAPHAEANLVPEDAREIHAEGIGRIEVRQRRWVDGAGGEPRLNKRIELCCFDAPAGEDDTYVFHESVRLLGLDDFAAMYAASGLRLEETFGDYDGGTHGPESPRLILLARRA